MGDDLLGGRYRLEKVLGGGGTATVWRAHDTRLDRPVAVKVLDGDELRDPSVVARFDREARTVARLAHPNIVSVYDVGTQDGTGYIVMELVDGVTVASMLADGPLPIEQAASIARQTADALGAAHANGIVHRDVKPANIMLTGAGTVQVCDFGIARELRATGPALTAAHTVVGTAAYMAPEQAASDPVDARADLYALGCVLYAMLTGAPPFTGAQPIEVLYQQLHSVPPPVRSRRSDVPPALDALVMGLLAKDPVDRPADAASVRAALKDPYAPLNPGTSRVDAGAPAVAVAGSGGVADATDRDATAAWASAGGPPAAGAVGDGGSSGPGLTWQMARAAVPSPVRPEPGDGAAWYPTTPMRRVRFVGPVPIAVVLAAAIIAGAIVITALLDRRLPADRTALPPPNRTPAASSPAPAPSPSTTTPSANIRSTSPPPSTTAPAAAIDAVRTVLGQVVAAGQIDPGPAGDLNHQLDDIDHTLADGHAGDVPHKIDDMRKHLGGLVHDGKLAPAGYVALIAALDTLTAAVPVPSTGG